MVVLGSPPILEKVPAALIPFNRVLGLDIFYYSQFTIIIYELLFIIHNYSICGGFPPVLQGRPVSSWSLSTVLPHCSFHFHSCHSLYGLSVLCCEEAVQ